MQCETKTQRSKLFMVIDMGVDEKILKNPDYRKEKWFWLTSVIYYNNVKLKKKKKKKEKNCI